MRLKSARRERTLTQRQLADLGRSTQQNISRYEKGYIPDSWFLLARLHAEKAIDLNWLLDASASLDLAAGQATAQPVSTTQITATITPARQATVSGAADGDGIGATSPLASTSRVAESSVLPAEPKSKVAI
jgi:transcriptional regulator with XRE-family HTH domain